MREKFVSKYTFFVQAGELWLKLTGKDPQSKKIGLTSKQFSGAPVASCAQSSGEGEAIKLSVVLSVDGKNKTYHCVVRDPAGLFQSAQLRLRATQHVLSTDTPVNKITHSTEGMFVSAQNGDAYYVQSGTGRPEVTMFKSSSGPLDDILAAKAGIATFLENFAEELPKIAGAVEKKVSKTVLDTFASQIKDVEAELKTLFDKSLSDLIRSSNHAPSNAQVMANFSAPTAEAQGSGGASRQAVHALLIKKMDAGRYLNGFSSPESFDASVPAARVSLSDDSDPLDELGKLFEPFSTLLNAKTLVKLKGMAVNDLVKVLSGNQPFSSLIEDFFSLFKVDDIMAEFNTVLSGGQVSKLLGDIKLKQYLDTPIKNEFFQAFYEHFFPGKKFTACDLIAFTMAIVAFCVAEIQGKESDFHDTFNEQQNLTALTGLPAELVTIIAGTSATLPVQNHSMMDAAPQAMSLLVQTKTQTTGATAEPHSQVTWEWIGGTSAVLLTLAVGTVGVVCFGTGLIASSVVGGVAGAFGQAIGGLGFKRSLDDAAANIAGGFTGGFAGSFVATLLGNKAFASWALKGDTPTARLNYLRMIMAGSAVTLGGGGGGVVSSVVKTKIENGTVKFDDAISLAAGITAGLGGGTMGCGLQFSIPGLSGSPCLPIAISATEMTNLAHRAIVPLEPAPPVTIDNTSAQPNAAAGFPAALPTYSLGVYPVRFQDGAATPNDGLYYDLINAQEFGLVFRDYQTQWQKQFWLESGPGGVTPAADKQVDMLLGVHGVGRYVFPAFVHQTPGGGANVNFSRTCYKDDFAEFVSGDAHVANFLTNVRNTQGRNPRIKLSICFAALPFGCCSVAQKLATTLRAEVYASRPPFYYLLDNGNPEVPGMGGWIKYTP